MGKYTKANKFVSGKDMVEGKGYSLPAGSRVLDVVPCTFRQGYTVTYEYPKGRYEPYQKNPCAEIPLTATEVYIKNKEKEHSEKTAALKKAMDMVDIIHQKGYTRWEELTNMNYEQLQETFEMAKKNDLYEVTLDGKVEYGEYLTKDSKGQMVFELKGSGKVVSVPEDACEKVMPYTVSIKFHQGASGWSAQKYDYFLEKDQDLLGVGDMIFVLNSPNGIALAKVTGVDTKSSAATKQLSCFKLEGELLNQ